MAVTVFEFGEFKLDCGRFELYRNGRSVKLERKPMELLILLATRNGHLVTRAEIAERLWDREVFVDTEHGINTAIRKIRQGLRDDTEQPQFLLTITGKGYRFIGTVVQDAAAARDVDVVEPAERPAPMEGQDAAKHSITEAEVPVETLIDKKRNTRNSRLRAWIVALAGVASVVLIIVAGVGLIGFGTRWRGWKDWLMERSATPEIKSLAVLPLDNLSGDRGQDYFADGMTDELTTMLAKNSTLRVTSRTSVMQYKGVHRPLREIAGELGVDGILEGSVSRAGDKVHMTIQLIQAPSDRHLWAESYDRNANDVVSLPQEAARAIAKRLDSAVRQAAPTRFVSPEAHDAYQRGRYLWYLLNFDEAFGYFKKATELQPDYALGWSGLADYYGAGADGGQQDPRESLPKEEAAALKAVELDDTLSEAHLSLAAAMYMKWDWERSEQEVSRAIELNPRCADAYNIRSYVLIIVNRLEEAVVAAKKAMDLDPFARPGELAAIYATVRQYDAAVKEARMRLETFPDNMSLHLILMDTYRRKGALKEATEELEKIQVMDGKKEEAAKLRRNFQKGGYNAVIYWELDDAKKRSAKHYVSPVEFAQCYAELGRREETLSLLEEGYREHSPMLLDMQNDPAYDFLHAEPRYRAIVKGIGMPPRY